MAFLLAILNSSSDYRKERKTASKPTAIANKSSSYDVEQTKRLLDVLQFELLEENNLFDRVPIQVEYTMVMSELRYGQHYSLKMRVGAGQFYLVKDCDYVIKCMLVGKELPFGKNSLFRRTNMNYQRKTVQFFFF